MAHELPCHIFYHWMSRLSAQAIATTMQLQSHRSQLYHKFLSRWHHQPRKLYLAATQWHQYLLPTKNKNYWPWSQTHGLQCCESFWFKWNYVLSGQRNTEHSLRVSLKPYRKTCSTDQRPSSLSFLLVTSQEGLRQVYDGMYKFLLVMNFGGH